MDGTILLWIFFGVWAGFFIIVQSRKLKESGAIGLGGGLLLAILVVVAFEKFAQENIPVSFKQAGIFGKKWNDSEAKIAAKITVTSLSHIDDLIADADRRGDAIAAKSQIDTVLEIIRGWNDQDGNPTVTNYRNCTLATVHVMDGVVAVMSGKRYVTRDHFKASLDACKSAI